MSEAGDRLRKLCTDPVHGFDGLDAGLMAAALREGARRIRGEIARLEEKFHGIMHDPSDIVSLRWAAQEMEELADELEAPE